MELNEILKAVTYVTNISEEDMKGSSRLKDIVFARHLYFYVSHKKCSFTYSYIGNSINRDHSTVMYACNKIKHELKYYSKVVETINKINFKLSGIDDKWLNYHTINNNINISHVL